MKKFLLIAAMAALALGASADGYKLEKVWQLPTSTINIDKANIRQGFGMNGKFYINDKNTAEGAIPTVYEIDENGLTGVTFEGGRNCGITHDEAGNIIVSDAVFPGGWVQATIKVINPTTGEVKVYEIPEECGMQGRCDFLGTPQGNLMEDGALYLTGRTNADVYTDGVAVFTVADGEVDYDNCYLGLCDAIQAAQRDNMTVCNYYEDINGEPSVLFVYRSMGTSVRKLAFDGSGFTNTTITLPGKGACNGTFPIVWDNKELFIYPQTPNYLDGFAISEANAEEPMFVVEPASAANPNGFQCNWLNAEVDADGVTIYQYAPGAYFTVWRLTKDVPIPDVYMLGGNVDNWAPNEGTKFAYNEDNNLYTLNFTFDGRHNGYNYFGFTNELAEYNDQGSWDYIAPFRFGAVSEGDFDVTDEQLNKDLSLTYDNGQSFKIPAGEYNMTLSLENMTLYIEKVAPEGLKGDANEDHEVNISDAILLISAILNSDTSGINFANSDINGDSEINITDAIKLINFVLNESWGE